MHTVRVDDLIEVYSAKCRDNCINYSPEQALKFVEKVQRVCKKRRFVLTEDDRRENFVLRCILDWRLDNCIGYSD